MPKKDVAIQERLKVIETGLQREIFDQDDAISVVVQALLKADYLLHRSRYRALFTFIGPLNSGKHFLATRLMAYDDAITEIKTFHMDSYVDNENGTTANNFIQEIMSFIIEHPQSIVVLEDIEKSDLQVQLLLMTLLTDKSDQQIDLSGIVIIFTTTRASTLTGQKDFQELFKEDPFIAATTIIEKLSKEQMQVGGMVEQAFDPKLLSLMHENTIVPFKMLTLPSLIKIGARALNEMSQNFLHKSHVSIEYQAFDQITTLVTLSLSPYLNAKYIKEKLPEVMFSHIYEAMKQDQSIQSISCTLSATAKKFLKVVMEDQEKLLKKLRDQNLRITLKWEYHVKKALIEARIVSAGFVKNSKKSSRSEHFQSSEVSFDDIAGHEKVKKELLEVKALLKEPNRLEHFHLDVPKGVLLFGTPHIGKKMLAKALAAELDMPYMTLSGAALFDEVQIHQVYEKAKQTAPSVVILEDIDIQGIIGEVLSPVLADPFIREFKGVSLGNEPEVFTIVTANSLNEGIEPLFASGMIDIRIEVPKLDMLARRFFIEKVLELPNDGKIDTEKVVRYISGMDGKELKQIGVATALDAARKGVSEINEAMLLEQINIIKYGSKLEKKQIKNIEKSMESTAYHEAGHAVLSYFLMPETKIEQVTVAPRSEALGFVSYSKEEFVDATSKAELFNNICVLLAGRGSTIHKYSKEGIETGAVNDLEVANLQIYAAVALFGMDDELFNLSLGGVESGYQKELFDKQVQKRMLVWLKEAEEKTQAEVEKHWNEIDAVAQVLIKKEVIDGSELKEIILKASKSSDQ